MSSISISTSPLPSPPPPSSSSSANDDADSYNRSLPIIAGILAAVVVASAAIHFLLRLLPCSSSSSSSIPSAAAAVAPSSKPIIHSLPLRFIAAVPCPHSGCAVCLSRFRAGDALCLLPSCLHAFHSPCIDSWLRASPSCPLCRSPVDLPHESPPPPPQLPAESSPSSSSSYQDEDEDEDGETVATRQWKLMAAGSFTDGYPHPPSAAAEVSGGGWLKDYVDRLASSASSPFSSWQSPARGSGRFEEPELSGVARW